MSAFVKRVFLHDHGPFDKDCNIGCGWYKLGEQQSFYVARLKRCVSAEEWYAKDNKLPHDVEQDIQRQMGFGD